MVPKAPAREARDSIARGVDLIIMMALIVINSGVIFCAPIAVARATYIMYA